MRLPVDAGEGDPHHKAHRKQMHQEIMEGAQMEAVQGADVIVTNPDHVAIALKYDTESGAPQVVAKGVDLLALRIREIADDSGVMRVENRPLARELYATVEVGHYIPAELYAAVAEVLAYVYRAEERKRLSGEGTRPSVAA